MAAPPDFHHGGAASLVAPACRISALRATATTRATADGVVGVVSIVGGDLCSISPNVTALRLLDANGKPLHVPTSSGNTVNQPPTESSYSFGVSTGRMPSAGKHAPDLSSTAARIGFAWSGTYCGPAAASVEISIEGHQIRATISGPGPTCKRQASSVLIPGTLGAAGQGVVPAPMSWRALRARLVLPSTFTPGSHPRCRRPHQYRLANRRTLQPVPDLRGTRHPEIRQWRIRIRLAVTPISATCRGSRARQERDVEAAVHGISHHEDLSAAEGPERRSPHRHVVHRRSSNRYGNHAHSLGQRGITQPLQPRGGLPVTPTGRSP